MLASYLVAVLAGFVALNIGADIAARARKAEKVTWILVGAFAMGIGVWGMHFTGMLAFHLPIPVSFDVVVTAVSLIPAVLAGIVVLTLMGRPRVGRREVYWGGLLMGGGIGAMHYTGMAAMEMPATLLYRPGWFAASIVIAVILAVVALSVRVLVDRGRRWPQVAGALVMGLAVVGMHYAAMVGAEFYPHAPSVHPTHPSVPHEVLGAAAIATAVLIMMIALAVSAASRRTATALHAKAVLDTTVDAVITIDEHGTIESFNHAAERIFGHASDEMVGHNVSRLMPEPFRSAHDGYLDAYLKTGERRIIGVGREIECLRKDGSRFPADLAVSEVVFGGRRTFTGIVRDISRRRRAETELRAAKTAAEKASAAKELLVANMSHELRTPLNAIIGYSDLLIDDGLEAEAASIRADLVNIKAAGHRLLGMVDAVLLLTDVGAEGPNVVPERVDVRALLDAAAGAAAPLAKKNRNVFRIGCPEDMPAVTTDRTKLARKTHR